MCARVYEEEEEYVVCVCVPLAATRQEKVFEIYGIRVTNDAFWGR